jgi:ubiquitin-protein ligase
MKSPPNGMIVGLIDESDLHKWTITMDGPPGSPYAVCKKISKAIVTQKLSVTSHHPSKEPQDILAQLSPKFSELGATLNT